MRCALAGTLLVVTLALAPSAAASDGSGDGPTITVTSATPKVGNSASPTALPGAAAVAKLLKGIPQRGLTLGDPNAPVTLTEYIDLQCPVCEQFETAELAPLVEKYVRAGKLKITMQPWGILDLTSDEHDSLRGQKATIGAAAQNKAFNFAQVLYDNQGPEESGWLDDAMISRIAASVDGLKPAQLATDANSAATGKAIASITKWARNHPAQMTGTPTLYLAGGSGPPKYYETGVPDLAGLEAAIDAVLKKEAPKTPSSGGHKWLIVVIAAVAGLVFAGLFRMSRGRSRPAA